MSHKFSKSLLENPLARHVEGDVKHTTSLVHPEVFISHEQLTYFEHVAHWRNLFLYTGT